MLQRKVLSTFAQGAVNFVLLRRALFVAQEPLTFPAVSNVLPEIKTLRVVQCKVPRMGRCQVNVAQAPDDGLSFEAYVLNRSKFFPFRLESQYWLVGLSPIRSPAGKHFLSYPSVTHQPAY